MDPSQYDDYSTVFDYFSDPKLFPSLTTFMLNVVLPNIKEHAAVTDIGGGTGIFSAMLLERMPSIQLTIIEPSAPMLAIAKNRLGERARYYQAAIDEVLPSLDSQDAFIFQRSLYAIYNNQAYCRKLFYRLNQKLRQGGGIFISDFDSKYDVDDMKEYILNTLRSSEPEFNEASPKWQIMLNAMNQFNMGVDSGRFHLITELELDDLLGSADFKKTYTSKEGQYAFQKVSTGYGPYWLHQLMRRFK
jgi:SAM-dependent methyltransferase